jgi:hypothetical protein
VKKFIAAVSSNEGEFDTSTTTAAAFENLGESLAGKCIHTAVRRCRHSLVPVLTKSVDEL